MCGYSDSAGCACGSSDIPECACGSPNTTEYAIADCVRGWSDSTECARGSFDSTDCACGTSDSAEWPLHFYMSLVIFVVKRSNLPRGQSALIVFFFDLWAGPFNFE